MIILKNVDLMLMKDMLQKELPDSINVLGGLAHILNNPNNLCHLEICVDSWPTFTTAICYRQKQRSSSGSSSGLPDICTFFTKDPATLRSLLLDEKIVNWRNRLMFKGIQTQHIQLIKELASLHGLEVAEDGGYQIFINQSPENEDQLNKIFPLPVAALDESHAELVDKHLTYGGTQESIDYIRTYIRHLPNRCVMDEKGCPVSWMLSDELCELRMAFTLPEHRRNGCFKALSLALIHGMSSMGLPIYCRIRQTNQPSMNAFTSFGFTARLKHISTLLVNGDRF